MPRMRRPPIADDHAPVRPEYNGRIPIREGTLLLGWGGLPIVLSGLLALMLMSSAIKVARGGPVADKDALVRILAAAGLAAMCLFGLGLLLQLVAEGLRVFGLARL